MVTPFKLYDESAENGLKQSFQMVHIFHNQDTKKILYSQNKINY